MFPDSDVLCLQSSADMGAGKERDGDADQSRPGLEWTLLQLPSRGGSGCHRVKKSTVCYLIVFELFNLTGGFRNVAACAGRWLSSVKTHSRLNGRDLSFMMENNHQNIRETSEM